MKTDTFSCYYDKCLTSQYICNDNSLTPTSLTQVTQTNLNNPVSSPKRNLINCGPSLLILHYPLTPAGQGRRPPTLSLSHIADPSIVIARTNSGSLCLTPMQTFSSSWCFFLILLSQFSPSTSISSSAALTFAPLPTHFHFLFIWKRKSRLSATQSRPTRDSPHLSTWKKQLIMSVNLRHITDRHMLEAALHVTYINANEDKTNKNKQLIHRRIKAWRGSALGWCTTVGTGLFTAPTREFINVQKQVTTVGPIL